MIFQAFLTIKKTDHKQRRTKNQRFWAFFGVGERI